MPRLLYDPTVWDELLRRAADGYLQFPFGGLEVGGVLYGCRENDSIRVLASRPILCEHASGPSFLLSEEDQAGLARQMKAHLDDGILRALEPLGWYHSHTRGDLQLTPEDRALHSRFFPHPWQVAVVLRPAELQPTRTGVFWCKPDGTLAATPQISAFDHIVAQPYKEPAVPRARRWMGWIWAVAACASLAAGVVGARFWLTNPTPPALSLRVAEEQNLLVIHWNAHAEVLQGARGATIEILDGDLRDTLPCNKDCLAGGRAIYTPSSPTVDVRMQVQLPTGRTVEEFTRFIGRRIPGKLTAEELAVTARKEQLQLQVTGMQEELKDRRGEERQLEETLRTMQRATRRRPLTAPTAAAKIPRQTPLLTPPSPTLPATQLPTAAPLTTVPRQPAAPPPPRSPVAGKFLWIGTLPKNGVLTISGHQASVGTLTGGLPGVPVRVGVYPADLAPAGLMVYTNNPRYARHAVAEAPGAHNGWNKTTYVWDDRRAHDLLVMEAPTARNHWNRLVVRGQSHRLAVVVVEWENE